MIVASLLFFGVVAAIKLKQAKSNEEAPLKSDKDPAVHPKEEISTECIIDCTTNCNPSANVDNGMRDSFKTYDQHIIIMTSVEDWPSHIEQGEFFKPIIDSINNNKQKQGKIKITAMLCTDEDTQARKIRLDRYSSDVKEVLDILVYPEGLLFSVQMSQIDHFASFLGSHATIDAAAIQSYMQDAVIPPPVTPHFKTLVLVCTHGSRDKRCGRAGPQVMKELHTILREKAIPDSDIAVRGSTHIGGHKFAGVLITYPKGDWYGKVTTKSVRGLLEDIQANQIHHKCFRGTVDW
jgi:hypothetical protein